MTQATRDMTVGKPTGHIVRFALPLMLGSIFQQMYSLVDTMVVGQYIGVHALAALGAADWLNWLILGIMQGFTQGFGILMAQRFGAGDHDGLRKTVSMSYLLTLLLALVFTAIALSCTVPVLGLLNTPADVIPQSLEYLYVCYSGLIVVAAYNIFATVLRSLGNSRAPLVAMIIASLINIGLDLLFVCVFHWGIAGAAVATVIAQLFSALYCFMVIRKIGVLHLQKTDFKADMPVVFRLLKLGAPMAFQNGIIGVGGMVVQRVINGFGFVFLAGFTATNKLYGLLELAAISFGYSMATFTGQNLGAGKPERIKKGMNSAIIISFFTSSAISILMILFGRNVLSLFISSTDALTPQVLAVAYDYLFVMCVPLFILYLLHAYRSALQGMGDTILPMVSGIAELVMRIGSALLLPGILGQSGVFFAEPIAWLGAAIILMSAYYYRLRKLMNGERRLPGSPA